MYFNMRKKHVQNTNAHYNKTAKGMKTTEAI